MYIMATLTAHTIVLQKHYITNLHFSHTSAKGLKRGLHLRRMGCRGLHIYTREGGASLGTWGFGEHKQMSRAAQSTVFFFFFYLVFCMKRVSFRGCWFWRHKPRDCLQRDSTRAICRAVNGWIFWKFRKSGHLSKTEIKIILSENNYYMLPPEVGVFRMLP